MSEFDAWAEFYDLIHDGIPGDAEFYAEEAGKAGGAVLELGAGTGRITEAMVRAGADVTGLEISGGMLDLCRRRFVGLKLRQPTLVQGDMRDFGARGALGKVFKLIVMPYRAFMHLLTPEDQEGCLRCALRHLDEGGRLVIDTWMPNYGAIATVLDSAAARQLKLVGRHRGVRPGTIILHYQSSVCDEFEQRISERHLIRELDLRGDVLREVELPLVRTWTTRRELEHLVRICGYEVEAVYGDYDRTPLEAKSLEMIWVVGAKGSR